MKLYFLTLNNIPIFEQLKIEEALLRADDRNYFVYNEGSIRSIIMGISTKPHDVINLDIVNQHRIPLIQRFSGGGTVIADENTFFTSFILNKEFIDVPLFPEPVLRWAETFYKNSLKIKDFHLFENDFVINDKKCGGNAQYIQKKRFVQHTSFLWDYSKENMEFLLFPKKVPNYRKNRAHHEFLCRLKDHLKEKQHFKEMIQEELYRSFTVEPLELQDILPLMTLSHRKATTCINLPELSLPYNP